MTNLVGAVGEGLISPHSHILLALFFRFGLHQSKVSSRGGDAYLPDFTGHVPLAWELKPHLEGMLSPGEMEVTSESTDGSSRESQAGKEDSPRAVRLLGTFLFIESKLRHDAVRQKTGMKTVDEQIVNDFGF